ncbi:PRC-barrel domain-containing protein [Paractinoplanes hotanensis]|uniref:PRC-barrel domain-containing protein n=1 Tax=Paractinoplanes hotanensis TaxID=2906497 RepID=A0ABT0YCU9_9ACTN|nr:PRC-barrel domain-containing protein [Actinoplanes hotanensis]MCM4083876.1 PRC-barrel domain-containing protein [Actinoplanes hotanensis]
MLFSEATGRTVLSTGTAETVGTVSGFLVDPITARVVAIRLKRTHSRGDTVHWPDLTSFGVDNVTVASADVVTAATGAAKDLDSKAAQLLGKRLLTDAGAEIGTVDDIDFDPDNGAVISLLNSTGNVSGDRLIGCGSYAVVVKDAAGEQ